MAEENEMIEEAPGSVFLDEPEREIGGDFEAGKSLAEAEEDTQQKTDLQSAMKYLLPKYKSQRMNELLQSAMVSRIFPDNLLDKNYLLVMAMIEECADDDDIDIVGIISTVQDALSIGYEGRGRIDILEIAGVAHEEEMEKLSKELGLGG